MGLLAPRHNGGQDEPRRLPKLVSDGMIAIPRLPPRQRFTAIGTSRRLGMPSRGRRGEFAKQPTWSVPTAASVRTEAFKWLDDRKVDQAVRKQAEALWPTEARKRPAQPTALLDRVVKTIAWRIPRPTN